MIPSVDLKTVPQAATHSYPHIVVSEVLLDKSEHFAVDSVVLQYAEERPVLHSIVGLLKVNKHTIGGLGIKVPPSYYFCKGKELYNRFFLFPEPCLFLTQRVSKSESFGYHPQQDLLR